MKAFNISFLRFKLLECRVFSIEERIDKLEKLSLFFQLRFDNGKTDQINNKIEYLMKKKMELMSGLQNVADSIDSQYYSQLPA